MRWCTASRGAHASRHLSAGAAVYKRVYGALVVESRGIRLFEPRDLALHAGEVGGGGLDTPETLARHLQDTCSARGRGWRRGWALSRKGVGSVSEVSGEASSVGIRKLIDMTSMQMLSMLCA